ncbi:MAG TPA: NAD(P)/FAD-dependent oxidoreductase [Humibacillus xanthopallidus]|nr:NAD(P)/FAD-dependent oxidoreductase [Humibacillus xanthopallidus]
MAEEIDVVVVGAGQAGLATSHELTARGVEHVVLEATTPGSSWLGRWDSFTLVGPNHTVTLPGAHYRGDDPGGFMTRTEIADHLQRYAGRLGGEVRPGTPVHRLTPLSEPADCGDGGAAGYLLDTDDGTIRSRVAVIATGAYQQPLTPAVLTGLSPDIAVVDVATYRNPAGLPEGAVLVIGSGQSACQIAEELALAGRDVVMACGRAPWFYRRLEGRDLFDWLIAAEFYEQRPDQLASPAARHGANVQASGARGGHDLHYRTLAALGVRLTGHLAGVAGRTAYLEPDLAQTIAAGDAGFRLVSGAVAQACAREGRPVPEIPPPTALVTDAPTELDLHGFGAVVVACGFRSRYTEWIDVPGLVDAQGFPLHDDGESTVAPGLHFVGVHFLRRRRSSLLFGVGDDATATATRIASAG